MEDNGKGKKHRRQDKEKKIEDKSKGRSIEGRTKNRRQGTMAKGISKKAE